MKSLFWTVFPPEKHSVIIVMLHTFTRDIHREIERVLRDIETLNKTKIAGGILENYDWGYKDANRAKRETEEYLAGIAERAVSLAKFPLGINVLPNDYWASFRIAEAIAGAAGYSFTQLDHVGDLLINDLLVGCQPVNPSAFRRIREHYPRVAVLGDVHPKYYTLIDPTTPLERSAKEASELTDAVVVTGEATGSETAVSDLKVARRAVGQHPLIVGSGLTPANARVQLAIADGAIVGTALKRDGNLESPIELERVLALLDVIREV